MDTERSHQKLIDAFNSTPLLESAEVVQRALANTPLVGVFVVAQDRTIIYASPTAHRILDYRFPGELAGTSLDLLIPADLRERHAEHIAEFFSEPHERVMGEGMRLSALQRSGGRVRVEIALKPDRMMGENVVMAAMREVTD